MREGLTRRPVLFYAAKGLTLGLIPAATWPRSLFGMLDFNSSASRQRLALLGVGGVLAKRAALFLGGAPTGTLEVVLGQLRPGRVGW